MHSDARRPSFDRVPRFLSGYNSTEIYVAGSTNRLSTDVFHASTAQSATKEGRDDSC